MCRNCIFSLTCRIKPVLLTTGSGKPYIRSIRYEGNYKGINFTMVYDEDYGFVSFDGYTDPFIKAPFEANFWLRIR